MNLSPENSGSPVYRPEEVTDLRYDQIWVSNGRRAQVLEIEEQLRKLGVPRDKVLVLLDDRERLMNVLSGSNQYDEMTDRRVGWLRNFASYAKEENLPGNVAECGVLLLHDYFHPELPGVKRAVREFEKERGIKLCKVSIGDFGSSAIL